MKNAAVRHITPAQVKAKDDDLTQLHMVGALLRPGVEAVVSRVEEAFFMPPHGDNAQFTLMFLSWEGMPYFVASVPWEYKSRIDALLHQLEWRLADGVPHAMTAADGHGAAYVGSRRDGQKTHGLKIISVFPMTGKQVFTLEVSHASPGPHIAGVAIK